MYIHTQHSTDPACPPPALTRVPAHVPAHSPCHINTNCPHMLLSQQLLHRNCHHLERLLGQEAMWHLPDPDAITSMLLRAKPWQLPAPEGRGFLPLAPGQGSQLSPSSLQRTRQRAGKWVRKYPLNALICLSPKGDCSSSTKHPMSASAQQGGGSWSCLAEESTALGMV